MAKLIDTDYFLDTGIFMYPGGFYYFYHRNASPSRHPLLYTQIVNNASSDIEIWDPYFNYGSPNNDHEIFDSINNNVTIKILTLKGIAPSRPYMSECFNAIKARNDPSKNTRLGIRVINKGDPKHENWHFHDRFLIIDQSQVYLIGSSVGHHIKVKQSTGIFKIQDEETSEFIQALFSAYWAQSADNEIAIRNLYT